MSLERVKEYLKEFGAEDRVVEFPVSSATVELAAQAIGCEGKQIAKTLSFQLPEECLLIVAAGDAKVDNLKFKETFGAKAKMISPDQVEEKIGHGVGGVCPFGVNPGVRVCLDASLKRFETVYPACGSANSAIRLTLPELETFARTTDWVDVCKNWE